MPLTGSIFGAALDGVSWNDIRPARVLSQTGVSFNVPGATTATPDPTASDPQAPAPASGDSQRSLLPVARSVDQGQLPGQTDPNPTQSLAQQIAADASGSGGAGGGLGSVGATAPAYNFVTQSSGGGSPLLIVAGLGLAGAAAWFYFKHKGATPPRHDTEA